MTKIKVMITALIGMAGFTACNSGATEVAKQDAVNLNTYVDSVEKLTPVYTVANWSTVDNGYQERALLAEKNLATLEAADKAKVEESKVKYAALKAKYETKLKENEMEAKTAAATPDYRQVLRNRLFGEGKMG